MLFAVDNILTELMAEFEFCRMEEGQLLFYLFMTDGEVQPFGSLCTNPHSICATLCSGGECRCAV